jgi:hypothetical protein
MTGKHMKLARYIIFTVCILTVTTSACLHGNRYYLHPQDALERIVFCALVFLTTVGVLGFVAQFFARRASKVLFLIFFGFLAGIMATNFISEIATGTEFSSLKVYFISYGLMLLFFVLAIAGLVLFEFSSSNKKDQ